LTLETVVRSVESVTPRAKLVRIAVDETFAYAPGQAVLVAPRGVADRRPFSIASAPEDAKRSGVIDLLIGTDAQTDWSFDPLPGDRVAVEGPIGTFTFPVNPPARRFLFVAGGTGIAPLRAMLRHALGIPHERIALFYSARTPYEFAFEPEFRALAEAGTIELLQTVTRDGSAAGTWTGARGRITAESLRPLLLDTATLCFVCGPASMVADVPRLLQQVGIGRDLIRIEEW
jgi:NAD(P)H-flavin reductase